MIHVEYGPYHPLPIRATIRCEGVPRSALVGCFGEVTASAPDPTVAVSNRAKSAGWREIDGFWLCPACRRNPDYRPMEDLPPKPRASAQEQISFPTLYIGGPADGTFAQRPTARLDPVLSLRSGLIPELTTAPEGDVPVERTEYRAVPIPMTYRPDGPVFILALAPGVRIDQALGVMAAAYAFEVKSRRS